MRTRSTGAPSPGSFLRGRAYHSASRPAATSSRQAERRSEGPHDAKVLSTQVGDMRLGQALSQGEAPVAASQHDARCMPEGSGPVHPRLLGGAWQRMPHPRSTHSSTTPAGPEAPLRALHARCPAPTRYASRQPQQARSPSPTPDLLGTATAAWSPVFADTRQVTAAGSRHEGCLAPADGSHAVRSTLTMQLVLSAFAVLLVTPPPATGDQWLAGDTRNLLSAHTSGNSSKEVSLVPPASGCDPLL